jgi:hypothetical protein
MSDETRNVDPKDVEVPADLDVGTPVRRFFRPWKDPAPLTNCENCSTELQGRWCAKCGQPAIHYHRAFGHVIVDMLDQLINWDTKIFGTLFWIITQPWRLTNAFLAGHRARYMHPLRLYLLVSLAFFLAVNYGAKGIRFDPSKIPEDKRAEVAAAVAEKRAEIQKELDKENLSPEERRKAQDILDTLTKPTTDSSPAPSAAPSATPSSAPTASPSSTESNRLDYGAVGDRPFLVFDEKEKDTTPFERWLETRAKEKMGEHGTKMGLFITTLFSNLPYMMGCCIPLFAFVLKFLYLRRRIFYIDHLIYALHIHSFFYTGVMLIVFATIGLDRVLPGALAGWIVALLWITFVVQIFLSIRYVYRQGWFISALKFLFGGFVYFFVLLLALAATFFITLAIPS